MHDLISRKAAIDALGDIHPLDYNGVAILEKIKALPSAEEMAFNEWCTDCKEYDHEKGCCPRFNHVIRETVEEVTKAHEEKRGKWNPVSEGLPEIDMGHPHHENYLVQYDSGYMDVAAWSNVNRFWTGHVTEPYWICVECAEIVAWMPLPEPWKGEEG